jgi:ribosomal protein S20
MVQKTRRKTVLSMTGALIAHETVLQCSACSRAFGSEALLRLVGSCCNVAYDVMVFVGRAMFQRHRNAEEVRAELLARNVRLSASEVDYLGRRFISYLAHGHRQAAAQICEAMKLAGGYILHLDATHDGDAPALMTGLDSLSKIVLANVKLPSEHAEHIVPFLRKVRSTYGPPMACVHDMGTGICKAVAEVFPCVRDFVCHFHFLRDIGKDFLEPAYGELRSRLRKHAISSRLRAVVREMRQHLREKSSECARLARAIKEAEVPEETGLLALVSAYSLALWSLHGKRNGDGYGFPFDRPLLQFAERLLELADRLPQLLELLPNEQRGEKKYLFKLTRVVSHVAQDPVIHRAVEELHWRSGIFDSLRSAMRIAPPGGGNGLNDEGTTKAMSTIRQAVKKFRRGLARDRKLADDPLCCKMAEQIDKYGKKLFADPIEVDTPNGKVTIYPQRTNNILEQFFRGLRSGHRRKTGNNSMRRVLQTMLADTPLVKNLDNPAYMNILLGGKANLEELFAELDMAGRVRRAESQPDIDHILPGFRSIMKLPTLPEQVFRLFTRHAQMVKSN